MIDQRLDRSISRDKHIRLRSTELKDVIKPTYYMKNLQYYYPLPPPVHAQAAKYKEHFVHSLASIKYVKKIRVPSYDNILKCRMQLARLDSAASKSTLR